MVFTEVVTYDFDETKVQLRRKKKAPFTREHAIMLKKNLQNHAMSDQCYFVLMELLLNQSNIIH